VQIAFVLYPGFTALDLIGPFQVLADVPGHEVVLVAEQAGPVPDHTGHATLTASVPFADVPAPDVVVVPGALVDHEPLQPALQWLAQVHPTTTWTTSVCTGSHYLAAAGILDGVEATCHWARTDRLERLGAVYVPERVVERGRVITAAGVSAGIDMALTLLDRLHGPDVARAVQLAVEYDPHPPFDAGSPAAAGPELTELVRATLG
jgi:transcriptional regulator GlxA family with amidase domain